MLLPDFFFALGPWRRPEEQFRARPLQVDIFFLIDNIDGGDPAFWRERTMPMVRFYFQTLHDQTWDEESVADSLYDQVLDEAVRYLGPEIHRLLSPQFEDAMGRLVWSDSSSLWSLPMVFFVESVMSPPPSLRVWNITRAATFLNVGCLNLLEWMVDMFRTQSHGFSVIWTI